MKIRAIEHSADGIQFRSTAMAQVVRLLRLMAADPASVLLLGETGVGKSTLAAALHGWSGRSGAFRVHSAGADPEKWRADLFGHVRGAYTGASGDREGLLRCAKGGTLFFDEIGDVSPANQVELLDLLARRRFRPLGSDQEIAADARIVSATNHDLHARVALGAFRDDLRFRLAEEEITVPPLRERPEDIEPIALAVAAARDCGIEAEALRRLEREPWPGNVRELERAVRRALRRCGGPGNLVRREHVEEALGVEEAPATTLERRIREAFAAEDGYQARAAARLGMPRRTFGDLCKRLGISAARTRGRPRSV